MDVLSQPGRESGSFREREPPNARSRTRPSVPVVNSMSDPTGDISAGYERVALEYMANRSGVGASVVRDWALSLPGGAAVLDIGCGHGVPISAALLEEGLAVHGIDPSPTLVSAFRARFPGVPVECGTLDSSSLFGRSFDAAIAWGVLFLLEPGAQPGLIGRVASALQPGGSFIFTAPVQQCEWQDSMTGLKSVSLGGEAYRQLAREVGLQVLREGEDEGQNHYYVARKRTATAA